jgi:predicted phage terminase large subunit-like protein
LRSLPPEILLSLKSELGWTPEPHQVPPAGEWTFWGLVGGRGAGKTDGGAAWANEQATTSRTRGIIIAPSLADARRSCVEGPSGLLAHNPSIRFDRTRLELHWPNGSMADLFGAFTPEDVERLRAGGNRHWAWFEEMAAWRQLEQAFDHARLGLRLGAHPRGVFTTTPKPRRLFVGDAERIGLLKRSDVVLTHATTYDNPYLAQGLRDTLIEMYGGTRLGRQELDAEWLTDVPGALWRGEWIDTNRRRRDDADFPLPGMARAVVAIDPAVTHGPDADETGIVCAGLGTDGEYYVLDASGYRLSPAGWADKAFDVYDARAADLIVAERNNGGEMVEATLRQIRPRAPIETITATRGKTLRAEPISRLYEKGLVHHVGPFAALEEQMTTFPVANEHDDLVDALVYALTELSTKGERKWTAA